MIKVISLDLIKNLLISKNKIGLLLILVLSA